MRQTTLMAVKSKLSRLPSGDLSAVEQFIAKLQLNHRKARKKRARKFENVHALFASESSLRKDWDKPEEDKAWSDL